MLTVRLQRIVSVSSTGINLRENHDYTDISWRQSHTRATLMCVADKMYLKRGRKNAMKRFDEYLLAQHTNRLGDSQGFKHKNVSLVCAMDDKKVLLSSL